MSFTSSFLYRDFRGYIGNIEYILGLCSDSGTENGSYYIILGLYWDNGQENGLNSYCRSHFLGHKSAESSGFARCQSTAYRLGLGFRV